MAESSTQARRGGPTDGQIKFLHGLASRHRLNLDDELQRRYGRGIDSLSKAQAHELIDEWNSPGPGTRGDSDEGDRPVAGGLVVPANIFPAGALAKVVERYGVAGGVEAFRAFVAPEPRNPKDRLSDDEIMLGLQILEARGLSVVKKQGYLTKIKGKLVVMPAIAGLRAVAARTGQYAGIDPAIWYDRNERPHRFWNPEQPDDHPAACEVTVYRMIEGERRPFTAIVTWRSFAGSSDNWIDRDDHQIQVVAERHALYKAFPEETEGLEDRAPTEDELERAAQGAIFAWIQTEGLEKPELLRLLGAPVGASLADVAADAGGWRELWRRLNRTTERNDGGWRAALGERVTLQLNAGDDRETFWTEAVRARWGAERVLQEFLCKDADELEAKAAKEGWPRMTLLLRALIAKYSRDAVIDGQTSPEQRERERELRERVGIPNLLANEDPPDRSGCEAAPEDDDYLGVCEHCHNLPAIARTKDNVALCRECGEALIAAAAAETSAPAGGNGVSGPVAAPEGPPGAADGQSGADDEISPDDEMCPVCAERPVRAATAEGIGVCLQCLATSQRYVSMPADVRDYASFCGAVSRNREDGGLGLPPAQVNVLLGRVGWQNASIAELAGRWHTLQERMGEGQER